MGITNEGVRALYRWASEDPEFRRGLHRQMAALLPRYAMIHLGYEVGTGKAVEIPLRHLAVTGQTQESGKTTTLEALIDRSGLRAVAFVTKRAESGFQQARAIPPYFRERADWQFVAALLEATLREKLKFQRSWIMKLCEARSSRKEKWAAPRSLADVHRNVKIALETATGIHESVYTELEAYLRVVIPQIESLPYERELRLQPGINVMDLSRYSLELQSLVVRSVLEWVYEEERDTVVIIPEAWEFIPQKRGSPVLLAAEQLIRKGAAAKNFVWLDSQDIAGVHKDVLRQVGVWILGVQREANETKRTLAHIPVGAPKPKAADVMMLGRGEFFVCYGDTMRKVYVQPAWLPAEAARRTALGETLRTGLDDGPALPRRRISDEEAEAVIAAVEEGCEQEDSVWKERYEKAQEQVASLEAQAEAQRREIELLQKRVDELADKRQADRLSEQSEKARLVPWPTPLPAVGHAVLDGDALYEHLRTRLLGDPQVLAVLASKPEIRIEVERPEISVNGGMLRGRLALLIHDGFFDSPQNGSVAFKELQRRGAKVAKPNVYRELDAIAELGFLTKEADGYQVVADMKRSVKTR
ncbi:MAG: hypothetical protein L0212_00770 [Acidobacteria bacterium]|nr:hypothetical protein [Acidobacteriota bacterium]